MSVAVRAGYKLTDVGVIPIDWDVRRISDLATVSSGGTPSRENATFWNGDIPWITTSKIDFNTISEADEFISATGLKNSAAKLFPAGTLLVALYGQGKTRGKVAMLGFEATTNQACAAISIFGNISRDYLLHFLVSQYDAIRNSSNSGSQENLNGQIVKDFLIVCPTSDEQPAIAAALSDVDALLAKQGQLIAKKQGLKQAAMQQLLTGQTRLPGFSGDWEVRKLGDISKITRGASPRPIDNPIWFDEAASVGWVRISDVTKSGMFLTETTQHLSALGIKSSRPVNRGSLIMSICATVGRPVITEIETCIHDGFVVFDRLQVNQLFLYYALKFIEDDWSKHGQTGSQMNLNTALINRTVIEVPDASDEQAAIATILSDMDTEIAVLEARQTKIRALKQGMMQELLTGKTRLV